MAKCSNCHNELIMCICPKALGGGGDISSTKEDTAYSDKVEQVATVILKRYAAIYAQDPNKLSEYINSIRIILNDESGVDLITLLEEGIVLESDAAAFKEKFKKLRPNKAMLVDLSDKLNLDVFPNPANQLVAGIKKALLALDGWPLYPDNVGNNFQQALQSYAAYYKQLSPKQQEILSDIFWKQIKKLGTPVIESNPENPAECNVYFLLAKKDKLAESKREPGTKKDLYLQGDFHGYDVTQDRQRVSELENTGIMLKQNSMPKDAIVTYRYVQIEPIFRDLSPTQIHGTAKVELPPDRYFSVGSAVEKEKPVILPMTPERYDLFLVSELEQIQPEKNKLYIKTTPDWLEYRVIDPSGKVVQGKIKKEELNIETIPSSENLLKSLLPKILIITSKKGHTQYDSSQIFQQRDTDLIDDNTQHRPPFFEMNGAERIFRVNPEPSQANLGGKQVNWSTLLSSTNPDAKSFKHYQTLYSTVEGSLHFADSYRLANTGPMELHSADKGSPYSDCTRAIHVFIPTSGKKIDNVVIVNDGFAYLALEAMGTFEQMVEKGDLSENTAFVFITALPPLLKTVPAKELNLIQKKDPKISMPGMGERTLDYEHRIDDYVHFIDTSLLPTLKTAGLDLPVNPNSRVMIGSSLAGTASIYIASKHPELIGSVIAQSPSPSNRSILKHIVDKFEPSTPRAHIHLSCGKFEQPGFAENTMLPFTQELSERLNIPLTVEAHGHQNFAWTDEFKHSLPEALKANNLIDNYEKLSS